jgi:hypothetical protein
MVNLPFRVERQGVCQQCQLTWTGGQEPASTVLANNTIELRAVVQNDGTCRDPVTVVFACLSHPSLWRV